VRTTPEAEDASSALLERVFGQTASTYTEVETMATTATVYLARPPSAAERADLKAGLRSISDCGLDVGPGEVRSGRVRREDWSQSWKRYFKTIEIGSALLIRPSWSRQRARRGQAMVVLDPGLSFGTGQHPTTGFCLRELVAARDRGQVQSLLDIGTGSGILAIVGAKLGYSRVRALDFDSVAVRVAKENTRRNRIESRIVITRTDLTRLPVHSTTLYDVICANLVDDLLIAEADKIIARLLPHGRLVLAGILATQFGGVRAAFTKRGLILVASRVEREWQSGTFAFPRRR